MILWFQIHHLSEVIMLRPAKQAMVEMSEAADKDFMLHYLFLVVL